jgi:predicted nucleic acid-binding protein
MRSPTSRLRAATGGAAGEDRSRLQRGRCCRTYRWRLSIGSLTVVRDHEVILSTPIIREDRSVGARPKHKVYHRTMLTITDRLERVALLVEPPPGSSFGLSDPDDEIYLATALAGRADVLITGSIRHFPGVRYGPIAILRPADFLARHGPSSCSCAGGAVVPRRVQGDATAWLSPAPSPPTR